MDFTMTWNGPVAVATWSDGENRINVDSLAAFNGILDEVESTEGPRALVLTGSGKFFSNGLDLDRFVSETITLDDVEEAFHRMERGEVLRSVVVL